MADYLEQFSTRCKEALKQSALWQRSTYIVEEKNSIRCLICPKCGSKDAWAYYRYTFAIICNRLDKCHERTTISSLFPEVIRSIEKEYQPTQDDPNLPATVYLNSRGIVNTLKGLKYDYHSRTRKGCGGAVMFPLKKAPNGKMIYNGRLFAPPEGEGKTHNIGSTSGVIWKHPGKKYNRLNELYVTEGIINALSLIEMGCQAVSVLSSGQDPEKLKELLEYQNIVLAFDNDNAGRKAVRRYMAFFKDTSINCDVALPPAGSDWNDILLQNRYEKNVKQFFIDTLAEYRFNGDLAASTTAQEYADTFFNNKGYSPKLFEFRSCYWFAKISQRKDVPQVTAVKVSNFTVEVDHFSLDTSHQDEHTYKYALKVKPDDKPTVLAIFTAKELSTQSNTVAAFLQKAKCAWFGDSKAANALNLKIVESKAPTVRQLQAMGFDEDSGGYFFKDFMIDTSGKVVFPDSRGIFKTGWNRYIRSGQYKTLKPLTGIQPSDIWELIYSAWGERGAVVFAWVFMSWFVRPVRDALNYFPFLSLHGDSQCGKSALARILSQCQCIDDEGLSVGKSSTTGKGLLRKIGQRSSLFIALMEANKGDTARIDIDSILTWYDGAPLMTRARFTSDIQTEEIPFTSSVMFLANKEIFDSKPQKERVVSLEFREEFITSETTEAFNRLNRIMPAQFASLFPALMQHRNHIQDTWYDEFIKAKEDLSSLDISARLIGTHALILAFHRILLRLLNINYDLQPYIQEIAFKKYQECNQKPQTLADIFFETVFDYVGTCIRKGNLKYLECIDINERDRVLWIRLPYYYDLSSSAILSRLPLKDLTTDLKEHQAFIKNSVNHRFVEIGQDNRRGNSFAKKSWAFDMRMIIPDIIDSNRLKSDVTETGGISDSDTAAMAEHDTTCSGAL